MNSQLKQMLDDAGISLPRRKEIQKADSDSAEKHELVLLDDNVNTFHHVIRALIDVCSHDPLQAEQCVHITHHSGRCVIKTGSYNFLKPMRDALAENGLSAIVQ
jgi:ATP-dependent Clp protease adaptor protein ClpS